MGRITRDANTDDVCSALTRSGPGPKFHRHSFPVARAPLQTPNIQPESWRRIDDPFAGETNLKRKRTFPSASKLFRAFLKFVDDEITPPERRLKSHCSNCTLPEQSFKTSFVKWKREVIKTIINFKKHVYTIPVASSKNVNVKSFKNSYKKTQQMK